MRKGKGSENRRFADVRILPLFEYKEDKKEKEYKSPIEKHLKPKKKVVKNQLKFLSDKNNLLSYNI